MPECK